MTSTTKGRFNYLVFLAVFLAVFFFAMLSPLLYFGEPVGFKPTFLQPSGG